MTGNGNGHPAPATHVVIAVPSGDEVKMKFAHDLVVMCSQTARKRPDIAVTLLNIGGSLIPKQRQRLVEEALAATPPATHVLFLDSDMRFPPETIAHLLARDTDAVCAGYIERTVPHRSVAFLSFEDWNQRCYSVEESTGLQQIAACGLGCALIRADVFRKIAKPWFLIGYDEDGDHYVGEDVFFCIQLAKAGVPLYLDHDLTKKVTHVGVVEMAMQTGVELARRDGRLPARPTLIVEPAATREG